MNGPALIGVIVAAAMLAAIYAASDRTSAWPRIGFIIAGTIGILALDVPWPVTILIFAGIGAGLIAWRAFNRFAIGSLPWEEFAEQPKSGLGRDWQARYGGDASGDNWRGKTESWADDPGDRRTGRITLWARSTEHSQALQTLGLDEGATDSDIRRAHRRLMKKHHPDRGGSTETATRLNRAREFLLQV